MNWTELLKTEMESAYKTAEGLIDLADDVKLDWKPSTENNWMTTGQLLMHISNACGAPIRGFATGDWGMPDGVDLSDIKPEDMLPPAEKLPTLGSVAEAKKLLTDDYKIGLEALEQISEEDIATKLVAAPWDPNEKLLGHQFLMMITHLNQHKYQLFYYLKLQGKPVNTGHLWS